METKRVIENKRYLLVRDVCEYLNVSDETIYKWIRGGFIPAHRVGRRWMFDREEIDQWVKSGKAVEDNDGMTGCSFNGSPQKWPESAPVSGSAALQGKVTHKASPYYSHPDFFNGGITPTLKLIKKFRTCQQTTEYTCGAASLRMVLDHWHLADKSERALAEEMDVRPEDNPKNGAYGCSTTAIETALERRGVKILPWQKFETAEAFAGFVKNQLTAESPILVEWSTWGGHWTVIIGFDDMGTADVSDDVLIMADPYDTTDHCQDGYVIVSFERFFYEWFDAGILSPGITRQQYVAPVKPGKAEH